MCVLNEVPLSFLLHSLYKNCCYYNIRKSIKAHIVIEIIVPRKCARAMRHHCSKETAGDKSSRVVVFFLSFFLLRSFG